MRRALCIITLLLLSAPGNSVATAPKESAPGNTLGESQWPAKFKKLFFATKKDKAGRKHDVVPYLARKTFRQYPAHIQLLFFAKIKGGKLGNATQLSGFLKMGLNPDKMHLLLSSKCVLCHSNPDEMEGTENLLFHYVAPKLTAEPPLRQPIVTLWQPPTPPPTAPSTKPTTPPSTQPVPRPPVKTVTFGSLPMKSHDLNLFVTGVHFRKGLMCVGCHGGNPNADEMSAEIYTRWPKGDVKVIWNGKRISVPRRKLERDWIPGFCAQNCHGNPSVMRKFNPKLPVDQLLKYKDSRHGQLLLGKKDRHVANCVSCHGKHGILTKSSPRSWVFPKNIPDTCGKCHAHPEYMQGRKLPNGQPLPTDQVAKYRDSVHGRQLFKKGDLSAPVCNDCHGNHAAMPPEISIVSQICRNCHVKQGKFYDGSPHKRAFARLKMPECETCHGKHDIHPAGKILADASPQGTCQACHAKYSGKKRKDCDASAAHFRKYVAALLAERVDLKARIKSASKQGIEVADFKDSVGELDQQIKAVETAIHGFDRKLFDRLFKGAQETVDLTKAGISKASTERTRRKWFLVIATLAITLFAFGLYLKIRLMDRHAEDGE